MIDFAKLFEDFYIEYWTSGKNVSSGWVNIQCPHCDDKNNHMGFNPNNGACVCWKCGKHSSTYTISKVTGKTNNEVKDILLEYTSSKVIHKKTRQAKAKKIVLPGQDLSDIHKTYLVRRGFNPDYLSKKYNILGEGLHGDYKFRIIIPIIYEGEVVSFQTRDVTDKAELRYKTLEIEKEVIHHKDILYNLDNCRKDEVLLVEGVFDVWRMGDNCVSGFGANLTDKQIVRLSRFKKVYIMFDGESSAQKRAETIAISLSDMGIESEMLVLSEGDPAELSHEESQKIMKELQLF